jgi:hypothetical protein
LDSISAGRTTLSASTTTPSATDWPTMDATTLSTDDDANATTLSPTLDQTYDDSNYDLPNVVFDPAANTMSRDTNSHPCSQYRCKLMGVLNGYTIHVSDGNGNCYERFYYFSKAKLPSKDTCGPCPANSTDTQGSKPSTKCTPSPATVCQVLSFQGNLVHFLHSDGSCVQRCDLTRHATAIGALCGACPT